MEINDTIKISRTFRIIMVILILAGAVSLIEGLHSNPAETWGGYLIVNYYFFSLSIGALFFIAIQYISQSGWATAFSRVPEAMLAWMPFAALFFLLLWFGFSSLYQWTPSGTMAGDPVVRHKSFYLNVPFFYLRMVIFFAAWIGLCLMLRILSRKTDFADPGDEAGIMKLFSKSELYSKITLFVLALTFSLSSIDWIVSSDAKWYSTIFALKNLIGAVLHGISVMTLVVFLLHRLGYFPFLNKFHLHDFARYIFMFSIIWGYFWFSQFMIIWYGNIPDETIYYFTRWHNGWKALFFAEIILNWFLPFMILLPVGTSRNMAAITITIIILVIGQYVDLFGQVMPAVSEAPQFTVIQAGMFAGYAGLYALVIATALGKASLIPRNHPFLEESLKHSFK